MVEKDCIDISLVGVKAIEKRPNDPSDQFPDIKMKKNIFASLGKEYSLYFQGVCNQFQLNQI